VTVVAVVAGLRLPRDRRFIRHNSFQGGSLSTASATDVSPLDSYECERRILREHRCNVLVEGDGADTGALLRLVLPQTREAVVWHRPYAPLELPDRQTNTFILRNAASLSAGDQARLLDWSSETGWRTQIISTVESPLFTLVESGLFDATLYYRLNIMLLRLTEAYPIVRSES
jgi:hypothetical protein